MMDAPEAGRALAQQLHEGLDWLVDTFVRRLEEAKLPGYGVFAQPVLKQSAGQLYAALIESLEAKDNQPLVTHAVQRAETRRQQGVSGKELARVAEIFATLTRDFVARTYQEDSDVYPRMQAAIEPLLQEFMSVFTAKGEVDDLLSAQQSVSRSGGSRMKDQRENETDYESILQQLQSQARQLETSTRVSRQLTAALDLDELLLQVVELIKSSFDYYHVHIYLLDIESGYLIMREGTGEVGETLKARGHRIELGRGLVGTVAQTGESLLTSDVSQQPSWLPNPLLPETRSELTVPLKIGDLVLGVLDVQSNEVGGLTETDLSLMESLGQQIAVAVQNAILFRETRAVSIISRAVSSGLGIGEVFAAVSRELKAVVDFDYMTIATYYEIVNQVELIGVDDRTNVDIPLEEGVRLPIDLCVPGMAIQQRRSIVAPDLTSEPFNTFIDAEILTKRGMRSVLSVPLASRGQIVATVNLVSSRERAFTAADVHLMEQVSGQLATALENAQIFENIQQTVAEQTSESAVFRAMVENSSEAIALANVQQILTYVNAAFYRIHGYDPETDDLTRRPLTSFIVSEDEGALSDEIRDHILGGGLWRVEVQHRRKDGTLFLASTTIFAVRDEEGEPIAIAALIRDISAERKIMAISQTASSTPELGRLAPLVLERIAADTDIDRMVLILYDEVSEEGPEVMSVVAVYDPETGGRRIMDEQLTAQQSPFSTVVYHERRAVFVTDVATDERLFERGRALLLEHGILSMLSLPIMVRDKVVGMVGIDWRKRVLLTDEQIALYQTMVNQVSTAVENARLTAVQQRELEQALDRRVREVATSTEVGQAIATAPELEELFYRVVTLIKEHFGYYHAHVYQIDRERNDLEMMAGYGEPGRIMKERGHRIPIGVGLTGAAAKTGEPVRADDVSKQENWLPNPLLPDTKSELAVPIKLGDQVLGVLDVQSDQLAGLTEDDELLLLGLCGQIAVSIQNTQILANIQKLVEERTREVAMFQALAENSVDAIGMADLQGVITYANRSFCGLFGYDVTPTEIVGESFYSLLDDKKEAQDQLGQKASAMGRMQVELRYRRRNGDIFVGETTEFPIVDEQGESVATAYIVRDVTDRQRLERITREIARARDLEELSGSVLTGLVEGTDIDHATLVLYQDMVDEQSAVERYVASYDHEADQVAFHDQGHPVAQLPVTAELLKGQQALRIDSPDDPSLDDGFRALMSQSDFQVALVLPIVSRERLIGAVVLSRHAAVPFTSAQTQSYQTIVNQIGVAIENANLQAVQQRELLATIRRLGREVATITEVAQEISSARALSEIFRRVVNLVQERFDYYHVRVYRVDAKSQELYIVEGTGGAGQALKNHKHRVPMGEGPIGTAAIGEPVLIPDVGAVPDWTPDPLLPDTQCELAVPIKMGNEVVGVLDLQNDQAGTLTEEIQVLMMGLCGQIATAISHAELLEEVQKSQEAAQRRAQQLELSVGVSEQLTSTLDLEKLLPAVVSLIQQGFDYYHVHIYLVEEETGDLVLMEGTGKPGKIMKERGHRIPAGEGLVGTAAATGSTTLVPDVRKHEDWVPDPLLPDTKSELSVPFKLGDQVVGVLDVQDDKVGGLAEEDQALLEGLGGQIAVAVQNARLFGEIESQVEAQIREVRVFQALTENAADAVAMADLEGKIFYANAAWYDLYGYSRDQEEAIGILASEFWPSEAVEWMGRATQQEAQREWRGEASQLRRDGTQVTVDLTLFVVRDEESSPVAVAAMGRDITVHKMTDQVTRLVSTASSQSELGAGFLRAVMQGVNVDRGSFILFEEDDGSEPASVRVVAAYDEQAQDVLSVDQTYDLDSDPIYGELYQAREAIVYNDLTKLDSQRRKLLRKAKIKCLAAFPLTIEGGRVGGMLLLERCRALPFTDEADLLAPMLRQVSLALSNLILRDVQEQRTQEMLRQRTLEVRTTTEIAQAIAAAPKLDELFRRVVTLIKERFGYYHVHVYRVDPERNELVLAAGYGEWGRIMEERGHRIPVGKGLTGAAAQTKEPVLVPDVSKEEDWLPNPLLPDTKSELAVPIIMGDEVLGVLDVQADTIGGLTDDTQVLLLGLCGQIATAIQNTRLLQETQESLRQTDLLLSLGTALSSLTEPQAIADTLVEQLVGIASIERCSVVLCQEYDEQDIPQQARTYAVSDRDPELRDVGVYESYALSTCPTLFERVVRDRQILVVQNLSSDDTLTDEERESLQQAGAVSLVVVPMVSGERVLGYLMLEDRQEYVFSEAELELYHGIANQSATAFSNALSLTEVQEALDGVNMMFESSRAIATATTREALNDIIIQRIMSTNVDRCEILLYERRERGARFVEVVGSWAAEGKAPEPGTRYKFKEYALADVAQRLGEEGSLVIGESNASDQPEQVLKWFVERGIKALALVPLTVGEEYIGFLSIERHKSGAFGADAVRFYETIASQSAVALRNMQLIDQSQNQLRELQRSYDDVARLADTVRQLSSPVIQIWEDILVLPLVGAIDSRRAMRIMEDLLTGITQFQAEQVIIDITGVPVMDTTIANHLLQTIKAAELLGAQCMLVGINSDMAQTIVGLGLDLSAILTYSNLRAGIQAALARTGFAIAPLSPSEGEETL